MKKKLICLIAAFCLVCGMSRIVSAEDFQGSPDWAVTFDGKKMESNFNSSELSAEVYQIQPGDTMTVQIKLKNAGEEGTDWYMTNEILKSLEDSQEAAQGGAYTYILIYTDRKGGETVLYNSESVGGEGMAGGKEGLYQATDSLSEYFFLDSLAAGQSGTVKLTVGLDGETQGNTYQNTLAQLQMNFAVEETASVSLKPQDVHGNNGGETSKMPEQTRIGTPLSGGSDAARHLPKTGDETNIVPYCIAAFVSGIILLFMGFLLLKRNQEREVEA